MWFDETKEENVVLDYEVHNETNKYDEDYSESSTEFFIAPSVGDGMTLSFAQKSIMSEILRKLKRVA